MLAAVKISTKKIPPKLNLIIKVGIFGRPRAKLLQVLPKQLQTINT